MDNKTSLYKKFVSFTIQEVYIYIIYIYIYYVDFIWWQVLFNSKFSRINRDLDISSFLC